MTRSLRGLTLVEVLIAMAVLAIGILALAQLQTSMMQYSSRAEQLRTATQIVEGELEWQRQTEFPIGIGFDCASFTPPGFSCTVDIIQCSPDGDGLQCEAGLASPIAWQITARAEGRQVAFEQSVVTTGQSYVAGVFGTGETDDDAFDEGGGDAGNGDDDGSGGGDDGSGGGDDGSGGDDEPPPPPAPCVNPGGKAKGKGC